MFDVAVIGAGPAGASAALFLAKAGKKTLVVDHDKGLTRRGWYENIYGILAISGPELYETGLQQIEKFGATLVREEATLVERHGNGFTIQTETGSYEAGQVIFATGLGVDLAQHAGVYTKPGTEPRIATVIEVSSQGRTNINGIWAAGTVAGVSVHAVITAGDGAKVAINLMSELDGQRYVDHDILKA
jgi:thioredoxin reductase